MTDVDRYITDEVLEKATLALGIHFDFDAYPRGAANDVLRAALPRILARHRADVLREVADEIYGRNEPSDIAASALRRMADEAVAE